MSSEALKENQGAVRMNSISEAACDIFALDQPTGRPSILRQSQADNISRTAHRGAKVCFQTPRRDPVTKKIMSPSRTSRPSSQEDSSKALETLTASTDQTSLLNNASTAPIDIQSNSVAYPDDDMPVQSRGAYTLDLDNLDAINPFQGSSKMQNSPPKSSALPESWISELVESDTTAAPVSAPQAEVPEVTDAGLDETLPFVPSVENSLAECSDNISSAEGTVILKTDNIENSATDVEESDMIEPAKVPQQIPILEDQPEAQDSPLPPAGSYNLDFDNLESLNPFQTGGSKIPNSPLIGKASVVSDPPLPSQEVKQEPELSVQTPDVPTSSDTPMPPQENSTATEGLSTVPPKENQMLLEFNFDDGTEVKRKPPPKRLGVKRPAGAKPVTKKPVAPTTEKKEPEPKQLSPKNPEATEPVDIPTSQGSYTFDFDDPNFNPFGTKAKMGNSPPRGVQTSPFNSLRLLHRMTSLKPLHKMTNQSTEDVESFTVSNTNIPQNPATQEPDLMSTSEFKVDLQNQTCDLGVAAPSEDEFVPGALFMPGGDFDGQIDYLEQFGSSTFKESALRKQSLYLKFDPLLKDSPKKTGVDIKQKSHSDSLKLLDDLPPPVVEAVVPDPTVLDLLVPTLKQPVKTEDSIIEVLKYMSEFEATITQITDEHKQKEDLAKMELERVLQEKDQLSKELNELERSFSSVVKRLDRCKEVIEGFKKNEETLKQYAQNCMDRLQKEEKRYQALKAHAEEKLDQANKAIAEIRTKTGAEVATLEVQLKREQLKVQSLEKDLEQKAKEVKDVTELCDELLLKVQKHGF
ncbi:Transforming acidic coiled-coil-containing protein 3 [Labeo rohita]|uniref:Transforming acidic coiled-coil-containing protein 3 n=1 Tax=Labeo rohita TaxID=84645 RepID=A0ABQ8M804_LABRO|nr:Transforming acidic coiled-coil-containing protein 3 [Labeo rohita]